MPKTSPPPKTPRVVNAGFRERVYNRVCEVPAGRVTTYGDVAAALGSPRVARHVGWALAALDPVRASQVPWHRVINATGRVSSRGEGDRADEQRLLLEAEGVLFSGDRVPLRTLRWTFMIDVDAPLDSPPG